MAKLLLAVRAAPPHAHHHHIHHDSRAHLPVSDSPSRTLHQPTLLRSRLAAPGGCGPRQDEPCITERIDRLDFSYLVTAREQLSALRCIVEKWTVFSYYVMAPTAYPPSSPRYHVSAHRRSSVLNHHRIHLCLFNNDTRSQSVNPVVALSSATARLFPAGFGAHCPPHARHCWSWLTG